MRIITWTTQKLATGYRWDVKVYAYNQDTVTIRSGECRRLYEANAHGKTWAHYFNSLALAIEGAVSKANQQGDSA